MPLIFYRWLSKFSKKGEDVKYSLIGLNPRSSIDIKQIQKKRNIIAHNKMLAYNGVNIMTVGGRKAALPRISQEKCGYCYVDNEL